MKKVLVLTEVRDGQLRNVSLEALAAAQTLAEGGEIVAAVVGTDAGAHAATLGQHGATTVYTADHQALVQYTPDAYTQALTQLIELAAPDAVVLGHTAFAATGESRWLSRTSRTRISAVSSRKVAAASSSNSSRSSSSVTRTSSRAASRTRKSEPSRLLCELKPRSGGASFVRACSGRAQVPAKRCVFDHRARHHVMQHHADAARIRQHLLLGEPAAGGIDHDQQAFVIAKRCEVRRGL